MSKPALLLSSFLWPTWPTWALKQLLFIKFLISKETKERMHKWWVNSKLNQQYLLCILCDGLGSKFHLLVELWELGVKLVWDTKTRRSLERRGSVKKAGLRSCHGKQGWNEKMKEWMNTKSRPMNGQCGLTLCHCPYLTLDFFLDYCIPVARHMLVILDASTEHVWVMETYHCGETRVFYFF